MGRIIITYPNPSSFEANVKVQGGDLKDEIGSCFASIGHRLIFSTNMDIMDMKSTSILESAIICDVSGAKIDIKWNNLESPQNQFKAIGEFLKIQAFKLWMSPTQPKKGVNIFLPGDLPKGFGGQNS